MRSTSEGGLLILVVGPSGAGKDTLIDGARVRLSANEDIVFVQRDITRPAEAGGEDHNSVDLATFEQREAASGYALSWRAHGLAYGLPVSLTDELSRGRRVVANVSRSVIEEARALFPAIRVISVTADPQRLAERLRARGREGEGEIAERVKRAGQYAVRGPEVVELRNDGSPEAGAMAMMSAILRDS